VAWLGERVSGTLKAATERLPISLLLADEKVPDTFSRAASAMLNQASSVARPHSKTSGPADSHYA